MFRKNPKNFELMQEVFYRQRGENDHGFFLHFTNRNKQNLMTKHIETEVVEIVKISVQI